MVRKLLFGVTAEEALWLMRLLQCESRPLDEIFQDLLASGPRISTISTICTDLAVLLAMKMYRSKERLVGFAILHQYSSQLPSTNSFVSVLVNAASNEEAEKSERVFILQLLCSSSSKNEPRVLKLSADDYMRNFDLSPHLFLFLLKNDLESVDHYVLTAEEMKELLEKNPDIAVKVLNKLENSLEMKAYIRVFIEKALMGQLAPILEQLILCLLANDPTLIGHCRLTAEEIKDLKAENPGIADKVVEILFELAKSPETKENFVTLASVDKSLQVQVVSRLIERVELKLEIIHMFVTNCISSSENIKDKSCHARFLCVFLQSLVQEKTIYVSIAVRILFIEVQGLCMELSSISAAAGIFMSLKP